MHDAQIAEQMAELTKFIAWNVNMADQLLREHHCLASGKCAVCKTAEYAQGPWPCTTYKAAARAAGRRAPVVAG